MARDLVWAWNGNSSSVVWTFAATWSSSNPNRRLNSFSESLNADYRHYEERFARVILTGEFCLLTGEISSIETWTGLWAVRSFVIESCNFCEWSSGKTWATLWEITVDSTSGFHHHSRRAKSSRVRINHKTYLARYYFWPWSHST